LSHADDGFEVEYFQFLTAFCSADTYSSIAIDIHLTCVAVVFQISPFIVKFINFGGCTKFESFQKLSSFSCCRGSFFLSL